MTKFLLLLIFILSSYSAVAQETAENAPLYGTRGIEYGAVSYAIGVFNKDGELVELFGPGTPSIINDDGNTITIPNYELPDGGRFEILGSWEATAIYHASIADITKGAIEETTDAISNATNSLAKKLCNDKARPTSITLTLSASIGLKRVAEGKSASVVEWNLAELCDRYKL